MRSVLGIDVGLSGALSYISNENIEVFDIPIIKVKDSSYSRWYDIDKLTEIINSIDPNTKIIIEYQRPMSQQGVVSVFRLGRGFGLLEGLFRSRFEDIELVDPKTWQNFLIKKYLSKEEILLFKSNTGIIELIDRIENKYREIFTKLAFGKSSKISKAKTFYMFLKTGILPKVQEAIIKKHDRVDSIMIAHFGELKSNLRS